MKRMKWLSALLASAMLLQVLTAGIGSMTVSAAAEPITATSLPDQWNAVKMYASESTNPGVATASFQNNSFVLSAEAGKVDSGGDSVAYAYMPIAGDKDFRFTARISEFNHSPTNSWALLMLKDGADFDSRMVAVGLDYNDGNFRVRDYRRLTNAGGGNTPVGAEPGPVYVRMERTDNNLRFTYSVDGGQTYQSRTNYNNNANEHYTHLNQSELNIGFAVSTGSAVFDHIELVVDGEIVFDSETAPVDDNPPAIPDGTIAIAKDGSAQLSWNTVTGATYYQVYSSEIDGGPYQLNQPHVAGNSTTVAGLTNGVPYYFVVSAANVNGASGYSQQAAAIPTALTVPGLYEMGGFSAYNTGGGVLDEDDPAYRKVYSAVDLSEALGAGSGVKVIEIMNDLDLGWHEIPEAARKAPFSRHNEPLLHPVLLKTGVSKITIDGVSGLTIFSRNGAQIRHAAFVFRFSSNIIIRNLSFDELWEWDEATLGDYDRNDWDYISLENGTSKVWIDHCTFGKAYDGVVDAKGGSNGITISWSRFTGDDDSAGGWVSQQIDALDRLPDKYPKYSQLLNAGLSKSDIIAVVAGQKKGHLVGASEMASDNSQLELTLHHNYYKDMMDRIPRLRAGNAHVFNIVVDNSAARAASGLISEQIAELISSAGYHFGVTSNGAISTENGALLVENSIMTDMMYPMRNNQKDENDENFTGKLKAINLKYSLDNNELFIRDSEEEGSPLWPVPAAPISFSWNTGTGQLPYLYEADELDVLEQEVIAGAGAGQLYWEPSNWMRTSGYIGEFGNEPDAAPTVVSGLQAQPSDSTIALRWGHVGAAASYAVYRADSLDGEFSKIDDFISVNRYTDTDLANGTTYYYKISASNVHGEGPLSAAASAAPFQLAAPAAPSGLVAISASTKIILDWSESEYADYYMVNRREAGGNYSVIAPKVFDSSFEDFTATADKTYEYTVIAVNAAGESAATAAVSAMLVDLIELSELTKLFEDTFNEEETDGHPADYIVSEEGGTLKIADMPSADNKSLQFFDDRAGVVQADKKFEAQTKIAGVEFKFMQEAKANSIKVLRLASEAGAGSTGNNYAAVAIETNGGHLSYRTNNGYTPFLLNYSAGVWYTIAVVANLESGKADVYVDGNLALEQISLFNVTPNIAVVQSFTANNNSANTYYLDDIRVYGEPIIEEPGGPGENPGNGVIGNPINNASAVTDTLNGVSVSLVPAIATTSDGRKLHRASLSPDALAQAFDALDDGKYEIALHLPDDDAVQVEVDVPLSALIEAIKSGETIAGGNPFIVKVQTALGSYLLPLPIDQLAMLADSYGIKDREPSYLTFTISLSDNETMNRLEKYAAESGLSLLAQILDFGVQLNAGNETFAINHWHDYATRIIPVNQSAASGSHATGLTYNSETGEWTHVPAVFVDGQDGTEAHLFRTGNSLYTVAASKREFADLIGHWGRSDIEAMGAKRIINGVDELRFAPERNVTRAEFAALLTRSLGLASGGGSAFTDVPANAWYASAIGAAGAHGLILGFEDGSFRPNDNITREQMAVMINRALAWVKKQAAHSPVLAANTATTDATVTRSLSDFIDEDEISHWASQSVASVIEAGIMNGTPAGALAPAAHASRAEAAVMLARLLRNVGLF